MLKSVRMINFMCFTDKRIEFGEQMTQISAKNGAGKTSIATAILWAVFNCDYELKNNPAVRNNAVTDKSDVEVELVFENCGTETSFRKVQKRKCDEKDPTKYADTNSYFVNEVPITMKAYNDRLGADIKKMLLGVHINAFLQEKADTLRAYLFSKIGNITDIDIAQGDAGPADLVELLGKYTAEEIRALNKKIVADTDKMAAVLEGQIKEKERDVAIAAEVDVSELELKRNAITERIKEIEGKIEDNDKLLEDRKKLSDGILGLKFQLSDMERQANDETSRERRELESEKQRIQRECERVENDRESHLQEKQNFERKVENLLKTIKGLQDKWNAAKNRVFDENSLVCPYCGQEYPQEKKDALRADFESHKAEEINGITVDGELVNKQLKEAREQIIEEIEPLIAEDTEEIRKKEDAIGEIIEKLSNITPVDVTQTEEYKAIQAQITEKEQAMSGEFSAENMRQELKAQLSKLQEQKETVAAEIAKSNTADFEKRLEELLTESRQLEQKKADAQRIIDLLDALEQRKNNALTDEVNKLFGLVKFQLYEFNKSGGYKNVCIPTVDGKSLLDGNANKALKMLGKIDICNAIQKMEGFELPIILDDGESLDSDSLARVAGLTDRQLIVFKVSDNEKLEVAKFKEEKENGNKNSVDGVGSRSGIQDRGA